MIRGTYLLVIEGIQYLQVPLDLFLWDHTSESLHQIPKKLLINDAIVVLVNEAELR